MENAEETRKRQLELMSDLLKNMVEYELNMFDYEKTEHGFKVWSIDYDGTTKKVFHTMKVISLVNQVNGMNCYVDFNAEAKRCELTIF
jgi:hypothetical protein